MEGVNDRLEFEEGSAVNADKVKAQSNAGRRRKGTPNHPKMIVILTRQLGPAFFPSEHDDLPVGVAFMVRRSFHLHSPRCSQHLQF